jgi:hypothetical protein
VVRLYQPVSSSSQRSCLSAPVLISDRMDLRLHVVRRSARGRREGIINVELGLPSLVL